MLYILNKVRRPVVVNLKASHGNIAVMYIHPVIRNNIAHCRDLGLVFEDDDKKYAVDKKKLDFFVNLEEKQQYALLCAASCSRFSREGLKKEAQLFLDCIYSIPKCGYTAKTIIKLAFLAGTFTFGSESHAPSRFSQILQSARQESSSFFTEQAGTIIERMLDAAINL